MVPDGDDPGLRAPGDRAFVRAGQAVSGEQAGPGPTTAGRRRAVVGQSVPQVDAEDRVRGRTQFVINLAIPRMLHARILRSPLAHARIRRIDTRAAEQVPGVVAILSGSDFRDDRAPSIQYGRIFLDQQVVALDTVRYIGDPVAAGAATTEGAAAEAVGLISVDYDPLPAVLSLEEALRPGAPLVHSPRPSLRSQARHVRIPAARPTCAATSGFAEVTFSTALASAAIVREDRYSTAAVQHVALEPHAVIADFADGILTIWTAAQAPHTIRAQLADQFRLPLTRVRVIVGPVGGGFGAKGGVKLEPLAAALAWKAGRPVRLVLSREEEFVTLTRHPAEIQITTGLSAEGQIVARKVIAHYNTGAYADVGPTVARNAGTILGGPYRLPNVEVDSFSVWTNLVPAGAFRGFGVPQACWAHESHMDALAQQAGIDPVELRRRNLLVDGDRHATGQEMHDLQYGRLLDRVTASIGWEPVDRRSPPPAGADDAPGHVRRGKGIGLVLKSTVTPSTSSAILRMNVDGSLDVLSSSVDIGQGVRTVLAQIAADAVGVDLGVVEVSHPDTQRTPFDQMTSSSRATFSMGSAIRLAADDLRRQLRALAGDALEAAPDDIAIGGGRAVVLGSPERSIALAALVAASHTGNLIASGSFTPAGGLSLTTGRGSRRSTGTRAPPPARSKSTRRPADYDCSS